MLREELLERIERLPAGMDVGIRLGGELFGIEKVDQLPADGETFGMLTCTSADVRSMLHDWGYAPDQVEAILAGTGSGGLPVSTPRSGHRADFGLAAEDGHAAAQ